MVAPAVPGSKSGGWRQPTWEGWQQVTESQPGRDWISEMGLQSLEGTEAPSRKLSRDTVPRNGAQGRDSTTKNKSRSPVTKTGTRAERDQPRGSSLFITWGKSGTTVVPKVRGH